MAEMFKLRPPLLSNIFSQGPRQFNLKRLLRPTRHKREPEPLLQVLKKSQLLEIRCQRTFLPQLKKR